MCCSGETANIDVGFVPLILLPVISKPSSSDLSPKLLISIICTRGLFEELRKLKSLKKKTNSKNGYKQQRLSDGQELDNLINKLYFKQDILIIGCCIPMI